MSRPKSIKLIRHNDGNLALAALYNFRYSLEKSIQAIIPEPESSFLGGILLGSKRAIPDKIQQSLKQTGTSHIIAISGANITILLGLLLTILPVYSPRKQFITTILISLFITLLTGASASVMRGAVIACFGRYLKLASRRAWATPFIITSLVLMLLGNPLLLIADPGFQLSFAAFAGLAYFGAPTSTYLKKWWLSRHFPETINASLAETVAATLGTMPLSLALFKQISLLGLVVNPLILWLLSPITFLGLCLLSLGNLLPIAGLIRLPLWFLLHTVLAIIQAFGKINFGVIRLNTTNEG